VELQQARWLLETCEKHHCLPWPGSLLEQPAEFLRLQEIVRLGAPTIERRPEPYGECD
jgi:hypothetical protein